MTEVEQVAPAEEPKQVKLEDANDSGTDSGSDGDSVPELEDADAAAQAQVWFYLQFFTWNLS